MAYQPHCFKGREAIPALSVQVQLAEGRSPESEGTGLREFSRGIGCFCLSGISRVFEGGNVYNIKAAFCLEAIRSAYASERDP